MNLRQKQTGRTITVDELDYDLGELEELVYDEDCSCEYDCDDDDCCCCEEDDDADLYEIECPKCHDKIYASEEMISDSLKCPNCNESITNITTED